MDELPHSLILQILSRLKDSADVARCRVASKAFNAVFPDLRSIDLRYSLEWHHSSTSSAQHIKPFTTVFLDLISKLRIVESVWIGPENPLVRMPRCVHPENDDFYLADEDFVMEWLPRVSESLKSLSISGHRFHIRRKSNVLPLISAYCHDLVSLMLKFSWLSVENLNPMPMLTSLTLVCTKLEDKHLNQLNKCFPNLQVLNLVGVRGPVHPKIHLLNLKTCYWVSSISRSLTLITPNLITLKLDLYYKPAFTFKKFENLRTLWLGSLHICSLLSQFQVTKTLENLTLGSRNEAPGDTRDSKLTLGKVFTVFPNVSSLCIKSSVWSELEACVTPEGWEILDGRKGLKTICAYLMLVDPSLTFSSVARVLDQCAGLLEVSLFIHGDVVGTVSASFMSKCMARWPGFKWRWGIWSIEKKDYWMTDGSSNYTPTII